MVRLMGVEFSCSVASEPPSILSLVAQLNAELVNKYDKNDRFGNQIAMNSSNVATNKASSP